ncbi:MAG: FecR domain-containing protein, partial [Thermoanaerobaculia bacterium]
GGASARVASIEGDLFALGSGGQALSAGDEIARGQAVRTGKGSGAVLTLTDGSRVELRERSELAVFGRGTNTTVDLERGAVIVEAAKRSQGNLFVDTQDCRVAVTGTIFSVNHGTKGSRVSVIEGEVRVERDRAEDLLRPGQQVTTRASLTPVPLADEIAWSRDLDRYLDLMAELNVLHEEIRRAVTTPAPRTSTHLLDLAPEGTLMYAALPNVSESLDEARRVFRERLDESPVLRELLAEAGSLEHQDELDRLAERVRDYGSFLGEEVALSLSAAQHQDQDQGDAEPTAVGYARVLEPEAFRTFVEQEVAVFGPRATIHLVSGPEDAAEVGTGSGIYLWPTGGYVVLATAPEGIAAMARSFEDPGATFQGSDLHQALSATYLDGVEWLLAVDLQSLLRDSGDPPEDLLGFEGARHLVARWSEAGERPGARAVLSFDGPRRGLASWLAEPAPMGSLEYVTGDAAAATAFVVRDPEEMVDELLAMLLDRDPEALAELERIQREEGFDLRADLAAPMGGEIAVALDGPLAPEPSFKVVAEVYDPVRLQQTLEWAVARLAQEAGTREDAGSADAGEFALTSDDVGGRTFYRLTTPAGGIAVHYTYDDAYLVAAPSRALLETALTARSTGANLPAAERFRRLLPADGYANFSAVVFQDLGSRLAPLTRTLARAQSGQELGDGQEPRELTPEEERTLEKAAERHPATLGYAYGEEDRVVFAATLGEGSFLMNALLGTGGAVNGLAGLEALLAEATAEGPAGP